MNPAHKAKHERDSGPLPTPVVVSRIVSTGADSFRVETGKPFFWLTAKQFANEFSITRATVYLWIADGVIPEKMREKSGLLKWRISSAAVPYLKEKFSAARDSLADRLAAAEKARLDKNLTAR